MKLFLVANGGDCSAGAMGNSNHAIEIKKENYGLIKNFMKRQNDFLTASAMMETFEECTGPVFGEINERYLEVMHEMTEKGIFKHKYHARTFWELARGDELERHAPITTNIM